MRNNRDQSQTISNPARSSVSGLFAKSFLFVTGVVVALSMSACKSTPQPTCEDADTQSKVLSIFERYYQTASPETFETLKKNTRLTDVSTTTKTSDNLMCHAYVRIKEDDAFKRSQSDGDFYSEVVQVFVDHYHNVDVATNTDVKAVLASLQNLHEENDEITIPVNYKIDVENGRYMYNAFVANNTDLDGLKVFVTMADIMDEVNRKDPPKVAQIASPVNTAVASAPVAALAATSPVQDASGTEAQTQTASTPASPTAVQQLAVPAPAASTPVQTSVAAPINASFDCAKAASKMEKLICSSTQTADADARLAAAYSAARAKSNDPAALKADERNWLTNERNACSDVACLLKVTEARIQTLTAM